jgi:hypothetical protein
MQPAATRRPGRQALYEPPEARPVEVADEQLDRKLLGLMRTESGVNVSTLLDAAESDPTVQDSRVLSWLSELAHYQLVEETPQCAEYWRLTAAGRQRLAELAPAAQQAEA